MGTSIMTADELAGEVSRLRQALWDIYAACGEDTDGDTEAPAPGVWTPDIDTLALAAVKSLRRERDAVLQETE